MIDLGTATRLAAGAIGEPGHRTFFIEVGTETGDHWFLAEKTQIAAFSLEVAALLRETGTGDASAGVDAVIRPPQEVAFRVGEIGIVFSEDSRTFTVLLTPIDATDQEEVRFTVSAELLGAMARTAAEAVTSGRPPCPKCGLAMDPEGHVCPTGNGDLRHHRP